MPDKETYTAWRGDNLLDGEMDFVSLSYDRNDGLRIFLEPFGEETDKPNIEIQFAFARAYRSIDEGYRLKQFGSFEADRASLIYTVSNSSFLAEFHGQSFDMFKGLGLTHYLIATANDCIDVLSESEPMVRTV